MKKKNKRSDSLTRLVDKHSAFQGTNLCVSKRMKIQKGKKVTLLSFCVAFQVEWTREEELERRRRVGGEKMVRQRWWLQRVAWRKEMEGRKWTTFETNFFRDFRMKNISREEVMDPCCYFWFSCWRSSDASAEESDAISSFLDDVTGGMKKLLESRRWIQTHTVEEEEPSKVHSTPLSIFFLSSSFHFTGKRRWRRWERKRDGERGIEREGGEK